jgi:UDP-N-acetylmuramoyl-tripeptide--D-alanyl-D-alanine ligase
MPTCTRHLAADAGRAATGQLAMHTPRAARGHAAAAIPAATTLHNAVAAAACALAAGVPLDGGGAGAGRLPPVAGPLAPLPLQWQGRAVTLVDDSYNANPDSVLPPSTCWPTLPGPRWLLLGDMGEVGDQGPAFHAEVGRHAAAARHRQRVDGRQRLRGGGRA